MLLDRVDIEQAINNRGLRKFCGLKGGERLQTSLMGGEMCGPIVSPKGALCRHSRSLVMEVPLFEEGLSPIF